VGTPRDGTSCAASPGAVPTWTRGKTCDGPRGRDSGSVGIPPPPQIELPLWTRALGWVGVVGLIYLLICAVGIISRGFRGLGGGAAHAMFAFAGNPWVGLSVGVLATVLIQSSTTTTAIAVSAVGSGALPIRGAVPIILGANIGTTVTCTLVALTFVGNRNEFRRALAASTIHDFYNLLSLLIFFPIELVWHPLERISGAMANGLYGVGWLPDPNRFNFVSAATRPVAYGVRTVTTHLVGTLGPLFTIVIGALLILVVVRYLGKLLKLLMVGKAREVLTKAVGRRPYVAMAAGIRCHHLHPVLDDHAGGTAPIRRSRHPDPAADLSGHHRRQPRYHVHCAVRGLRGRRVGCEDRAAGRVCPPALQRVLHHRDLRHTDPSTRTPVVRRASRQHRRLPQNGSSSSTSSPCSSWRPLC
jgi:hypothetical protein